MADERRGSVNCDKSFGVNKTKFSLAIKALKYFEVTLGLEPTDVANATSQVGILMEQELQYCHLWNASTEGQYSTADYRADMDRVREWFLKLIAALKVVVEAQAAKAAAANKKSEDKKDATKDASATRVKDPKADSSTTNPSDSKPDPKAVADDLLKALKDAISSPSKATPDDVQKAKDKASKGVKTFESGVPDIVSRVNSDDDAQLLVGKIQAILDQEKIDLPVTPGHV